MGEFPRITGVFPTPRAGRRAEIGIAFRNGISGTDSSRGVPSEDGESKFETIHQVVRPLDTTEAREEAGNPT
jgi:hypothetical protein